MIEIIKESKDIVKRFLERRKNIRREMTKLGRAFDSIFTILGVIIIIFLLVSEFSFGAFPMGFGILILLVIVIIPFGLIEDRIQKKASKKYKTKLKEQRLKFCMYCGGKLGSFQNFCPFCGKTLNQKSNIITKSTEIEKIFQEQSSKGKTPLAEQKEIINQSRKFYYKSFLTILPTSMIGFFIIINLLTGFLNFFVNIAIFLIIFLVMSLFMFLMAYMMTSMFIVSKFLITSKDIKLYIEKKLYFQINWSGIDTIEVYRVRFHGSYLKINYSNNYTIVSLEYCDYNKKKQKEIIKSLFIFSDDLKNKISIMKTTVPILDEVGMKALYEDIYNFARAQRFLFHKSID